MSADLTLQLNVGGSVELILRPPSPDIVQFVTTRHEGLTVTVRTNHMAYVLQIDKYIEVQVGYTDKEGNAATVDGDVVWSSSNPDIATAEVDGSDSTICKVTPTGTLGSSQIVATADADVGSGVKSLITTLDLTTVAGEAVAGVINVVGDPQPIP